MVLREYWYIACAASRLGGGPLAATVLDCELVLFRDLEGAPHALLDRCCHRGVRLSLGVVQDATIAYGYHDWRYDASGQCVEIPSLTADRRIPEGVRLRPYPCVEQDSYVWVWMGEGDPTPPPCLAGFDRYRWLQGSMPFRCDALKVIENNLDWCHPVFAHVGTHPYYFFNREHGFELAGVVRARRRHLRTQRRSGWVDLARAANHRLGRSRRMGGRALVSPTATAGSHPRLKPTAGSRISATNCAGRRWSFCAMGSTRFARSTSA